ncbi:uncharacterized protein LOC127248457 [Andrographis paniculata]|uniref:uncharacterized protein LOC127248457 n=1 Tax=Andrographis paniculata TaxID=175694 RepID=UPI0021E85BA2|nr:uncharacterized protein LOC127248457 [Andrographis paniculata]XP_051126755.1 uncharacterized protein LOC127248457 [Andrographis paniculata]
MDQKLQQINRLNDSHIDYMKMAMLKHEETFREQVYELHRLYQIQKSLMKDVVARNRAAAAGPRRRVDLEQPADGGNRIELAAGKCRVSEIEEDDDESDLELTLGHRSYYQKKVKASDPNPTSSDDHRSLRGPSFSSSSTGYSHVTAAAADQELLSWRISNSNLNSLPWHFQALTLNIT